MLRAMAEAIEPAFTRCLAIEAFAAGPAAVSRRAARVAGFAEVYRRTNEQARAEDSAVVELDIRICSALAGGVDEVLRGYVHRDRIAKIDELVPSMLEFVSANVARRA